MAKALLAFVAGLLMAVSAHASDRASNASIKRGEYLIGYGGCNDCHTPGWSEHGGQASKAQLLIGGGIGFQGPWGTTYPTNLRLLVQQLTAQQWIAHLRSLKSRPAMPWWIFRYLSDQDLTDMYAYIHALGPAGQPAHAYVPPGQPAPMPYLRLVAPPPPVQPSGH